MAEDNKLWRIYGFFNAGIPVRVPKLSLEIKEKKCRKHQLFNQIFDVIVSARLFILSAEQP